MNTKIEVVFDCETKKFFDEIAGSDPADLGVSIVSLYVEGKMMSFWEKDFPEMFKIFEKADRIIGFNSITFDVPALSLYLPSHWSKLPHFDILAKIKEYLGKRVSLDALARATLNLTKNDSGENAIKYWNKGDSESLAKLKKYCEMDVAITKDIYDFGMKNGYLKYIDFWNETHEVKVDFNYPKKEDEKQASLF
ncbi:MAG: ribonuclease H-like domain-containing protein [Patescibacteria group bacterium]